LNFTWGGFSPASDSHGRKISMISWSCVFIVASSSLSGLPTSFHHRIQFLIMLNNELQPSLCSKPPHLLPNNSPSFLLSFVILVLHVLSSRTFFWTILVLSYCNYSHSFTEKYFPVIWYHLIRSRDHALILNW
jgi:hypothetical protein